MIIVLHHGRKGCQTFNFRLLAKIANLLKPNCNLLRIECYQNFIIPQK